MSAVTNTPHVNQNAIARLDMGFPEVGILRKGAVKSANRPGQDLEDKFRLVFHTGCAIYEDAFKKAFKDTPDYLKNYPLLPRVRAMIPFENVWSAWQCYNEAYQNGRLILRADDKKILFYKDPETGRVLVRDGERLEGVPGDAPEEYYPGMVISYQAKEGGVKQLPTRMVGRLRLFLPEMGRLVSVTLKTTSYYDCINITQNLAAIQSAAWLNKGVAGGIPFYVFRRTQAITWNKKDGSCAQITKWLVCLEIDPVWAEAATRRMADFALTGSTLAGLLQPGAPVAGVIDPEQDADLEDDDEIIEDTDWQTRTAASQPAQPVSVPAAKPAPVEKPKTGPLPTQPQGTYLDGHKMSLEMAKTVKNHEGLPYWDIPSKGLEARLPTMRKANPKTEEMQLKIEAIELILAWRKLHPQDEPAAEPGKGAVTGETQEITLGGKRWPETIKEGDSDTFYKFAIAAKVATSDARKIAEECGMNFGTAYITLRTRFRNGTLQPANVAQ